MRSLKKDSKRAVNRHQTRSKVSAAAQERNIERSERQAGKKAAEQWQREEFDPRGEPSNGVYDDWKSGLDPDWHYHGGGKP